MSTDLPGRYPNLFLIGAPKAGTTALHLALDAHPDIAMSMPKEPHWFRNGDAFGGIPAGALFADKLVEDEATYRRLFDVDVRWAGDGSTGYLRFPEAPARIAERCPEARFVAILRDPVDRYISDWRFLRGLGFEPLDLTDAIAAEAGGVPLPGGIPRRYWDVGLYADQVRRWLALVGDRLLLLEYGAWRADPETAIRSVTDHLDLPPLAALPTRRSVNETPPLVRSAALRRFTESDGLRRVVAAEVPVVSTAAKKLRRRARVANTLAWPEVADEVRAELRDRYAPNVAALADLVDLDLSAWR